MVILPSEDNIINQKVSLQLVGNAPNLPERLRIVMEAEGDPGVDRTMKVLIAEDDEGARAVLRITLTRLGYEVEAVNGGEAAWHALRRPDSPRLAILDWMMPGMDGVEVCRRVRQRTDGPYIYLILLTARDQKEDIIEGMEAGADDYMTKPFDIQELKARLLAGRRILDLQAALLAAQETLQIQATHDPLTGLWNHIAILDLLKMELDRARRSGTAVGVILADLDHFKRVNDTYGHLAGDAVLRETARRMSASVRSYDAVGRYGGEEFLIVVPGSDALATLNLAERIRQGIGERPMDTSDGTISITVSLAVAASAHGQRAAARTLIRAADEALYRAKHRGRNRVELATRQDDDGDEMLKADA